MFRSAPHASLWELAQPRFTVVSCIYLLSAAWDAPAAIQRLRAVHHPRHILGDDEVTARQLSQRAQAVLTVVDREASRHRGAMPQACGRHLVSLVAFGEQSVPAWIADHDARNMRMQQVVEPCGPPTFFEGDMQLTTIPE